MVDNDKFEERNKEKKPYKRVSNPEFRRNENKIRKT